MSANITILLPLTVEEASLIHERIIDCAVDSMVDGHQEQADIMSAVSERLGKIVTQKLIRAAMVESN